MGCAQSTTVTPDARMDVSYRPARQLGAVTPAPPDAQAFDDEPARLAALRSCGIALDGSSDPRLEMVTELMASIFEVPIALVSLVDAQTNFFKGSFGGLGCSAGRKGSFCDAIFVPPSHEVLVVEDAWADARFVEKARDGIVFYAGAPLVSSSGFRLGSLCVIDTKPRSFAPELYSILTNFAELVVRELEAGQAVPASQAAAAAHAPLLRRAAALAEGVALVDTSGAMDWRILYTNRAWGPATGVSDADDQERAGASFWRLFCPDTVAAGAAGGMNVREAAAAAVAAGQPARLRLVHAVTGRKLTVTLRPAATDQLQTDVLVGIPNFAGQAAGAPDASDHNGSDAAPSADSAAASTASAPLPLWFAVVKGSKRTSAALTSRQDTGPGTPHEVDAGLRPSLSLARTWSTESTSSSASLTPPAAQGQVPPSVLAGLTLGPLVGAGGWGRVYRGRYKGRHVAVKVIRTPGIEGLKEAALGQKLEHPQIVQTLEYASRSYMAVDKRGQPQLWTETFIVMPIGTLYDALDRGLLRHDRTDLSSPPDAAAVIQTALEVASALSYLHSLGIVHGDVTGRNVLLRSCPPDPRGFTALLGDFGQARDLGSPPGVLDSQARLGTVTHQAPEVLSGGPLTKAADVWALGVLLWELWGGARAWVGYAPASIIYHVSTGLAWLELPPDTLPAYKSLCEACLRRDPAQRVTADAVHDALVAMQPEKA